MFWIYPSWFLSFIIKYWKLGWRIILIQTLILRLCSTLLPGPGKRESQTLWIEDYFTTKIKHMQSGARGEFKLSIKPILYRKDTCSSCKLLDFSVQISAGQEAYTLQEDTCSSRKVLAFSRKGSSKILQTTRTCRLQNFISSPYLDFDWMYLVHSHLRDQKHINRPCHWKTAVWERDGRCLEVRISLTWRRNISCKSTKTVIRVFWLSNVLFVSCQRWKQKANIHILTLKLKTIL